MPPNLSKILFHWGLEKDVYKIGLKVNGLDMKLCEWSCPLPTPCKADCDPRRFTLCSRDW